MVQFSRPDNDDSIGVWTDDAGGTTNIFQAINEVTPSDTDFVQSDNTPAVGETCTIGMSSVTDPAVSTGHILRWRYAKSAAAGRTIEVRLDLRESGTPVLTSPRTFTDISNVAAQDNYTLTGTEADNITNYGNLEIFMLGIRSGSGGARRAEIYWAELEVPNAPGGVAPVLAIPINVSAMI